MRYDRLGRGEVNEGMFLRWRGGCCFGDYGWKMKGQKGGWGGLCILEEGRWTSYRRRGSKRERKAKRRVGGIFEREEGHGRKGGRGEGRYRRGEGAEREVDRWRGERSSAETAARASRDN